MRTDKKLIKDSYVTLVYKRANGFKARDIEEKENPGLYFERLQVPANIDRMK